MKILVVSNLYPPYSIGGYEIGCKSVTNELIARGHQIRILTSSYKCRKNSNETIIWREFLHSFPGESQVSKSEMYLKVMIPIRQFRNQLIFKKHIKDFKPEIVLFWNLSHVGPWLFDHVARYNIPSACYVSDQWLAEGYHDSSYPIISKNIHSLKNGLYFGYLLLLSRVFRLKNKFSPPRIPRMFFTSRFIEQLVRKKLVPGLGSTVIHWGIPVVNAERSEPTTVRNDNLLSLVYSGQIIEYKGVKTAILAVAELVKKYPTQPIQFKLAGGGPPTFVTEMKLLVSKLGLNEIIFFVGNLDHQNLMTLLKSSDIYIFPSEWDEPFSISLLEGMSSGCAVVSTTTGGSSEILVNGQNSLTFEAGNITQLVTCLERLLLDRSARDKIGLNASTLIRDKFQLTTMVDRIEEHLGSMTSSKS